MSKPVHNLITVMATCVHVQFRSIDHDDRQLQVAGSNEFGYGSTAAGILANDCVYGVLTQHGQILLCREGAASHNPFGMEKRHRVFRWVDKAQQVLMLCLGSKQPCVLLANGQKYLARLCWQRLHSCLDIRYTLPAIHTVCLPGRALIRTQLDTCERTSLQGIGADTGGEGVCGINDVTDVMLAQPVCHSLDTAKTANAGRQRLHFWRARSARVRKPGIYTTVCQNISNGAGFGGAAQKQDACHG